MDVKGQTRARRHRAQTGVVTVGEYLQLVSDHLSDDQPKSSWHRELAEFPDLVQRLDVRDHVISTKLATCEHVFFTFAEMVALHRFVKKHLGLLRYGPAHEHNETPEDILRDRSSLYLGPHDAPSRRSRRVEVPELAAIRIEHIEVWRKTIRTQSRTGHWYQRRLRCDETSGCTGNPNGRRVPCLNTGKAFRAIRAGFAWDPSTGLGREVYRCPRCGSLFNLGEAPRPDLSQLAAELGLHDTRGDGVAPDSPGTHPPKGDGSRAASDPGAE